MNKIILVVEDQPDLRKLVSLTLDYGGHEVHEADNGAQGLRMIEALRPDLVLLDVMMPGELDGYQVCERVRAQPGIAATPIVFLTSRSQLQDLELGKLAGANAYLTKPFSPLQLIETVESILAAPP
ncbi:Response regulator receiver domain-containing protein [Aromatoleum tolulyticum]|uniref:Response regulator receiver domain-containing protein n=1 Tax=Aromatoleum tolulyticum TaxID=34027 RepID=A0A1N7BBG7_9RHOO|nr:response regulator [Aromatoleum tolulyticum]SIR48687.1 Response regulator receiver domain-containing protein [Aromatoleum tolulyticum]